MAATGLKLEYLHPWNAFSYQWKDYRWSEEANLLPRKGVCALEHDVCRADGGFDCDLNPATIPPFK